MSAEPRSRFIFRIKVTTEKIIYSFGAITANTERFIKHFQNITFVSNYLWPRCPLVLGHWLGVEVLRDGGDVPVERQQLLVPGQRQEVQARPQSTEFPWLPPLNILWDGVQQGTCNISYLYISIYYIYIFWYILNFLLSLTSFNIIHS